MRPQTDTVERRIARIAGRAHGVVTREELLAAGVTRAQVKRRIGRGALIRVHAGVYRVGHAAPSVEARSLAAVRAWGRGAALCDDAAAHLWGLGGGAAPSPAVSAPGNRSVRG